MKQRLAIVIGSHVQFFTRKAAVNGYRKPNPWLRLRYATAEEAEKARELYEQKGAILPNRNG